MKISEENFHLFCRDFDKTIQSSHTFLLMPHVNLDGDALGCALALFLYLKSLGKEPVLFTNDEIPDIYRILPGVDNVTKTPPAEMVDCALLFECPAYDRAPLGKNFQAKKIINIDHHPENSFYGDLNWADPSASSIGEIFFELFENLSYPLTRDILFNLYVAVFTDTGGFTYSNTGPRTHGVISRILERSPLPTEKISRVIYREMGEKVFRLTGWLMGQTQIYPGGFALVSLPRAVMEKFQVSDEDTQGFIRDLNVIKGIHTFGFLREISPGTVKASLRSNLISVGDLASKFSGGGHKYAAGCTLKMSLCEAQEKIGEEISKILSNMEEKCGL